MKILVAVGTRPEAIKLAPVIVALEGRAEVTVVSTGQHPQLVEQALDAFGLAPTLRLPELPKGRSLAEMAAELLSGVDHAIAEMVPDWLVVQGDTSSAFAAGLASFYRRVKLAHVEAGLRTHDNSEPFPEEANRVMLACIAAVHFAPTPRAAANLAAQGVEAPRILVTGNTSVDATNLLRARQTIEARHDFADRLQISGRPLVLITCHRRENEGVALIGVCAAIRQLARRHANYLWLFPLHPNPATSALVRTELEGTPGVALCAPLRYEETLLAIERATLVVTDSGGLQEEVAAFHRPVVVLRNRTERPEVIEAGFGTLAGNQAPGIVAAVSEWLEDEPRRRALATLANPFGDGHAAERIARRLLEAGAVAG